VWINRLDKVIKPLMTLPAAFCMHVNLVLIEIQFNFSRALVIHSSL
jgi:hypothetical protein